MIDALLAPADGRAQAAAEWRGDAAHWAQSRAVMLANDQLRAAMASGAAFGRFAEGDIRFRPTYKFDKKVHESYDLSEKRRIPAYTDRVLWRPQPTPEWAAGKAVPLLGKAAIAAAEAEAAGLVELPEEAAEEAWARRQAEAALVRLLRYEDCPSFVSSDHKPVVAEFDVSFQGHGPSPGGGSMRFRHRLARGGSQASNVATPRTPKVTRSTSAPTPRGGGGGQTTESALCLVM